MSVLEPELMQRLASGEDVDQVAEWYVRCSAALPDVDAAMSEFELAFFRRIAATFLRWRRRKMN